MPTFIGRVPGICVRPRGVLSSAAELVAMVHGVKDQAPVRNAAIA